MHSETLTMERPGHSEGFGGVIESNHLVNGPSGFYNAASWQEIDEKDGTLRTRLLGRVVEKAGEPDKPDVGTLVLLTLNAEGAVTATDVVWTPPLDPDGPLLEDSRAMVLSDNVAIGLTFVTNDSYKKPDGTQDKHAVPHPAVVTFPKGATAGEIAKALSDITRITHIQGGDQRDALPEGKNVTPLGGDLYAFRPEGKDNDFRLQVFKHQGNGNTQHVQYIEFPKNIPWARGRMGTTMPPIWISDIDAIFPVHGYTVKEVDGKQKFVYSIGLARLHRAEDGTLSVTGVSEKATINSKDFPPPADGSPVELHDNRYVTYCCGGVPVYDEEGKLTHLRLFVNVGDLRTFEVLVRVREA